MTTHCDQCGGPLEPKTQYCPWCGASVHDEIDVAVERIKTRRAADHPEITSTSGDVGTKHLFCSVCGNSLKARQSFCDRCGEPVSHQIPVERDGNRSFAPRIFVHLMPSGRIGQELFWQSTIGLFVSFVATTMLFAAAIGFFLPTVPSQQVVPVITVLTISYYVLTMFQVVKRLHDFDRSAWHLLFFLIPVWFIWEWIKAFLFNGDEFENGYGEPSASRTTNVRIWSWGAVGIGLFASIYFLSVFPSEPIPASHVFVGKCFNFNEEGLAEVVSCSDGEFQYVVTAQVNVESDGPYPSINFFDTFAVAQCPVDSVRYFRPLEESWAIGSRTITCVSEG